MRRPWVGVKFEPGTRRVVQVIEGSPAARGGLHAGDEIVSLDGRPIASARDFIDRVAGARVGAQVTIGASRAGRSVVATLTLAARPQMEELARSMLVDRPAPAFPQLAQAAGHVVVLDFWATWCGPCQLAVPHLNELRKQYGELRVLGLSSDSDDDIRAWVAKHHVEYDIVRDDGDAIAGAYAVQALPTLVVIDKAGVVRSVEIGIGEDFHDLDALVARLVAP